MCTAQRAGDESRGRLVLGQLLLITELPSLQCLGSSVAPTNRPGYPAQQMMWAIIFGTASPDLPLCSAPSAPTPPGWHMDKSSEGWAGLELVPAGTHGLLPLLLLTHRMLNLRALPFAANTANVNKMILAGL